MRVAPHRSMGIMRHWVKNSTGQKEGARADKLRQRSGQSLIGLDVSFRASNRAMPTSASRLRIVSASSHASGAAVRLALSSPVAGDARERLHCRSSEKWLRLSEQLPRFISG